MVQSVARTKHDVVAEFRHKAIIEAACRVFARSGFEATTVEAIAAEAELAKGTLYLYFKSKLDIYVAAIQGQLEVLDELTRRRVEVAEGGGEKLRTFMATRLAYLEDHRDFFKIYQFEFSHMFLHPTRANAAFAEYYRRQVSFLTDIIEEGIRAGDLQFENAGAGAFLVYDTIRGVATRRLLGQSQLSLEEDTKMAMNFICAGIGRR
jgi:AcrR family transcriptional regulator